jgi:hypothetical protein
VSPFARGATERDRFRVNHGTYGFESILKLITYRFGLGSLTRRHRYCRNVGRSFDWRRRDFDPPPLPDPPQIATSPCRFGGRDVVDSQQAHASDLAALEGLADRFGLPVYDGKVDQIFTSPDALKRALRAERRARLRRRH